MSVTPAQNSANLRTAIRNVAGRLDLDPANIPSHAQRVAYNQALAAEILKYPQSFSDQTLETARIIAAKPADSIEDASFSWSALGDAFLAEATITLPSVGNKLLIGAVIVAAVYFAIRAWRIPPPPAA